MATNPKKIPSRFTAAANTSLADFKTLCLQTTDTTLYPLAASIQKNIPIYDASALSSLSDVQDEWHHILLHGPGVFVIKKLYSDLSIVSTASDVFNTLIASEASVNGSKGDHFSGSGHNSRLWSAFSKHALLAPKNFIAYYTNPLLHAICAAWLGPHYRLTSQINIVHPGGAAQLPHRDYHLGFQLPDDVAQFPLATQIATQLLTLQGAVAHTDMPLESGPTKLLPFSQQFKRGYQTYRDAEYASFFEEKNVQLPLEKGDGLFFNPALFHAAGENVTVAGEPGALSRCANLLQVSSPFGKPMEVVETAKIVEACWNVLGKVEEGEKRRCAIRAVCEAYPFPVNLDRNPPRIGGMAPESEAEMVERGLKEGWGVGRVEEELKKRAGGL